MTAPTRGLRFNLLEARPVRHPRPTVPVAPPSPSSAAGVFREAAAKEPAARARGLLALLAIGAAAYGDEISFDALKQKFRATMVRDPLDSLIVTSLGCAYLFWMAERDVNPKCRSYLDALEFVTTNLSVGYCDIFAQSDAGKVIASYVMTIGPALAAKALEPPAGEKPQDEGVEVNKAILAKLDAILAELRQRP